MNKKKDIFRLSWQITPKCDLRCTYCNIPTKYFKRKELDTNSIIKGVDWIANQYNNLFVLWSGGEPTLRRDLYELSKNVALMGAHVGIVTNGNNLLDSLDVILSGYISLLVVSVDSGFEKTHDHLRNKNGLLSIIKKGIKEIAFHRPPNLKIGFNCVVTNLNETELDSVVRLAEEINIDFVRFIPVEHQSKLLPKSGIFYDLKLRLNQYKGRIAIQLPRQFVNESESYIQSGHYSDIQCYAVERFVHINLDGEILPCYMGKKPLNRDPVKITDVTSNDTIRNIYPQFHGARKPDVCGHCLVFNNWLNIEDDLLDFAY